MGKFVKTKNKIKRKMFLFYSVNLTEWKENKMELFLQQRKPIDKDKTKEMLLSSFKQNISPNTLIQCEGVHKYSKKNKKGEISLVFDFELVVEKGDLITIAGESGTGKSVILKLLAGYIPPDQGSILFLNEEISKQRFPTPFLHLELRGSRAYAGVFGHE